MYFYILYYMYLFLFFFYVLLYIILYVLHYIICNSLYYIICTYFYLYMYFFNKIIFNTLYIYLHISVMLTSYLTRKYPSDQHINPKSLKSLNISQNTTNKYIFSKQRKIVILNTQ